MSYLCKSNKQQMDKIQLDMFQSAAVGTLALILGILLTRKVKFLRTFCVPSPVSGGILFSLLTLALYAWGGVEVSFDGTLKDFFMLLFFTSVGFQSDIKVIRQGGKPLVIMLVLLVVLIVIQNIVPVGIAKMMSINPLIGMAAGSIPMTGGHGTAAGFAEVMEQMGLEGAGTIAMAAATFGLISGSLIGGPIAERLIRKKVIEGQGGDTQHESAAESGSDVCLPTRDEEFNRYAKATYSLLLVMGGGTVLSWLLQKTGITFPTYFGALILAAIVRNVMETKEETRQSLEMEKIVNIGNIALGLFLGMAMVSLKLWELYSLALPLAIMLFSQVLVIGLFVYFIAFPMLGRDYDAAVLVAGMCGFGLGATPNAMANMKAVCNKYHYTIKPFLIVPIIGAMFADLINTGIITMFLNWLASA